VREGGGTEEKRAAGMKKAITTNPPGSGKPKLGEAKTGFLPSNFKKGKVSVPTVWEKGNFVKGLSLQRVLEKPESLSEEYS